MSVCYICKNIETNQTTPINEICDICINKYTINNANNAQVNIKYVDGYICYYINDNIVPIQKIFINNIPVRPYFIENKLVYIKI